MRTAPNPLEQASTDNLGGLLGLKYFNTGAVVISPFKDLKLFSCSACQCHSTFFSKSFHNGEAIWERLSINLPKYVSIPKGLLDSVDMACQQWPLSS